MRVDTCLPRRSFEGVQLQRQAARRALIECAALCGAPSDGWEQNEGGRPLPNQGWHWSISHKHEWVAAVVAREPIGIDIESIVPRRDELLFDKVADASEWALVGSRNWENFYRIWTAKEAVLKAKGLGIGHLLECRMLDITTNKKHAFSYGDTPNSPRWRFSSEDESWEVRHFEHHDAVFAVAMRGQRTEMNEHRNA